MEADGGIERWQPGLARSYRRGEQSVQLPNVERISLGKVIRHVHEAPRDFEVLQLVAALRTLYPQHLAALG